MNETNETDESVEKQSVRINRERNPFFITPKDKIELNGWFSLEDLQRIVAGIVASKGPNQDRFIMPDPSQITIIESRYID